MIDGSVQDTLRQKYNPDGSKLRQYQAKLLEILLFFDDFCKKNNLTYWITAGTLLGAVRHQGFIPWDDDIDVCMPRSDFEKLCRIFKEDNVYVLQTHKTDDFYTSPYAKLRDKRSFVRESDGSDINFKFRGIFIDIFGVEHCPFFLSKFILHERWKLSQYAKKETISACGRKIFMFRKRMLFGTINLFNTLTRHYSKGPLRLQMGSGFLLEKRYEKDIFPVGSIIFEGYELCSPCNPDSYLTGIYGNYQQLPSESEICMHALDFKLD